MASLFTVNFLVRALFILATLQAELSIGESDSRTENSRSYLLSDRGSDIGTLVDDRPDIDGGSSSTGIKNTSPPQYMVDLYEQFVDEPSPSWSDDELPLQRRTFGVGNTVLGYRMVKGKSRPRKSVLVLDFRLGDLNNDITAAEIVFSRNTSHSFWRDLEPFDLVMQLQYSNGVNSHTEVIHAKQDVSEYDVFDVSNHFKPWLERRKSPHSFYEVQLLISSTSDATTTHLSSSWKSFDFQRTFLDAPLCVVYNGVRPLDSWSDTTSQSYTRRHVLTKRRAKHRRKGMKANLNKDCKLHNLTVHFSAIGWEHIKMPGEYNAGYCKGRCPSVMLSGHFNTTLHATIMNILRARRSTPGVPSARCVPISYKPLHVFFMKGDGGFGIEGWENMIVTQCGCR
ncbi:bone morphogenetic protein 2-like [Ptychodera flava]|uniref:bone morphogenetic protein 2-like n=1 Tax=Ptychodera flava TaxID=63121 RepID=UPI00396AB181